VIQHPVFSVAAGIVLLCATSMAAAQSSARSFNPKTSLILQGTYADYSSEAEPAVSGVLLGPETEPRPAGFSLAETELVIEANVDDQFHGWATVALENEDGETAVAVEEAYINTLALPAGFALKFGRFFSELGYQNHVHAHGWDFVDLPLAYRALLAGQVNDDGAQLRWVAPTDLFFEVGVEALRGAQFPGGGDAGDGSNAGVAFVHLGGDIGESHAWRVGLSHLATEVDNRLTGEDTPTAFTGDSDVSVLDFVYKWAPDGNPSQRNFVLTLEMMGRREKGTLTFDPEGTPVASAYEGDQQGSYLQGIYKFMPRWRVGLRLERLRSDNTVANNPGGEFDALLDESYDPGRASVMLDFSNSEFSRLRLQFTRDATRPDDEKDNEVFVQYVMSLGPHPAHQF